MCVEHVEKGPSSCSRSCVALPGSSPETPALPFPVGARNRQWFLYNRAVTSRLRRTLGLALPIMGGMVSQNVMNLVDIAMLGVLGDAALAAVGLAQFATFTGGAFIIGLATGVQATSARWLGAGRSREIAVPLNGGLLLVLLLGVPTSLLLIAFAPELFGVLSRDAAVSAEGSVYFQARLLGLVAMGTNFVFRGYWNAVNLSKIYMRTIILMNVTNIVLNWLLIFGNLGAPRLGVLGAGIGTDRGAVRRIGRLSAHRVATAPGPAAFSTVGPDRPTLRALLRLSVPAGMQHVFFAAGMLAFFWILGNIGDGGVGCGTRPVQPAAAVAAADQRLRAGRGVAGRAGARGRRTFPRRAPGAGT